jgi:putative ABC transport system permease protein
MIGGDIFISLAWRGVRLHLLRSLLAALGIVIGVIAITALGIMGANLAGSITGQLSQSGNVIIITPYTGVSGLSPGGGGQGAQISQATTSVNRFITDTQVKQIQRVVGANQVIPIHQTSDQITVGSKTGIATVLGLDPVTIRESLTISEGDLIRGGSDALVGPTLVTDFDLNLGSRIKIGSTAGNSTVESVRVSGILKSTGFGVALNTDRAIVVSDKFFTDAYGGVGEYPQVNVIVNDISQIGTIENNTDRALNRNENLPTVRIFDSGQFLSTINQVIGSITAFVTLLGAISLVVAAVSIFNVMVMSVSERVKEIGILRSIGTRKMEIRKMFLYEALFIGLIGSVVGASLSVGFGYLLVSLIFGNTDYFFTADSLLNVPKGMAIGIATCILSGLVPAWRAADLDPIEALRAE